MRSSGTNISKRRVPHADEPVSAGGLDVYDRPQRHLFLHAHISGGPKVPPVSVAESVVPVPGSPIRVVGSAQSLHKAVAPSDRPSEEAGVQAVDLSGRYYLAEPTEGPARTGAGLDPVVAAINWDKSDLSPS